jgi:Leucine-rich repeat (LRR) protein
LLDYGCCLLLLLLLPALLCAWRHPRNNALSALPGGLGTLPALTSLGLRGNPLVSLGDGGLAGLAATLTDLDLSHSQLKLLPESLGALSELVGCAA